MKVYIFESITQGLKFYADKSKNKFAICEEYLGTIDLDIKPKKKVVHKKREFKSIYELSEVLNTNYDTAKNIVLYYDVEE
jgi:hypothetical protein